MNCKKKRNKNQNDWNILNNSCVSNANNRFLLIILLFKLGVIIIILL